jgi:hypothetical protein
VDAFMGYYRPSRQPFNVVLALVAAAVMALVAVISRR